MNSKDDGIKVSTSELRFGNVLTVIFVITKLLGYIDWNWWLVFSPTIISLGLKMLITIIVFAIAVWASSDD